MKRLRGFLAFCHCFILCIILLEKGVTAILHICLIFNEELFFKTKFCQIEVMSESEVSKKTSVVVINFLEYYNR